MEEDWKDVARAVSSCDVTHLRLDAEAALERIKTEQDAMREAPDSIASCANDADVRSVAREALRAV